jgi:hypothetical protein
MFGVGGITALRDYALLDRLILSIRHIRQTNDIFMTL